MKWLHPARPRDPKLIKKKKKKENIIPTFKVQSSVHTHFTANSFSLAAIVKILVLKQYK